MEDSEFFAPVEGAGGEQRDLYLVEFKIVNFTMGPSCSCAAEGGKAAENTENFCRCSHSL